MSKQSGVIIFSAQDLFTYPWFEMWVEGVLSSLQFFEYTVTAFNPNSTTSLDAAYG